MIKIFKQFESFNDQKKLIDDIIQECLFDFLIKYQLSYSLDFTITSDFDFCILKLCKELPTDNKKNEWPVKREYPPIMKVRGLRATINNTPMETKFFDVSDESKQEYRKYMNHLRFSLEKEISDVKLRYPEFSFIKSKKDDEKSISFNNYISIVITFNYKIK